MAFDTDTLQAVDTRLKDVIDPFIDDDLCDCDSDLKKHVNKLIIVRQGIELDLLAGDDTAATVKVDVLNDLLDAGPTSNCDC